MLYYSSVMSKGLRTFKIVVIGLTSCLLAGIVLAIIVTAVYSRNLPSMDAIKNYQPMLVTTVLADDNSVIGEFSTERRKTLTVSDLPDTIKNAFVAAEDAEFFNHHGINPVRIMSAALKNIQAGHAAQGGSTITQQVAKSILLSPEKSFDRKIKEMLLAFKIEKALNKDEILSLYLNHIFLGSGAYGVEAASQTYFGKSAKELTIPEAAILAGLPRAPSRDNPIANPQAAKQRQTYVLGRMLASNFINKSEYDTFINSPVKIYDYKDVSSAVAPYFTEHVRRYVIQKYGQEMLYGAGLRVYTTMNLKAQLAAQDSLKNGLLAVDKRQGFRRPKMHLENQKEIQKALNKQHAELVKEFHGYKLLTPKGTLELVEVEENVTPLETKKTYPAIVVAKDSKTKSLVVSVGTNKGFIKPEDYKWASLANPEELYEEKVIRSPLSELRIGDVVYVQPKTVSSKGDTRYTLEQAPLVQGALISYELPSGAMRAMVGGYDYAISQFNRAVQAKRQSGSAFKPIVYGAALEQGFTPATILVDSPIVYRDTDEQSDLEKVWRPDNFSNHFYGDTTMRNALTYSRNIPTIKMVQHLKYPTVIEFAQKLGIKSALNADLTLALGSSALSMEELVSAIGVFANQGQKVPTHFIRKIEDRDGNVLEEHAPPSGEPLVKDSTAFLLTSMLKDVVEKGTATSVLPLGRPTAGKTGTTNDFKDAWFVGYIPQMITGVWIGFDEDRQIGRNETGGEAAAPIWLWYMQKATEGLPIEDFKVPASVVQAQVDAETGDVPTPKTKKRYFEYFAQGTAPGQLPVDEKGAPIKDAKPIKAIIVTGNPDLPQSRENSSDEKANDPPTDELYREDL